MDREREKRRSKKNTIERETEIPSSQNTHTKHPTHDTPSSYSITLKSFLSLAGLSILAAIDAPFYIAEILFTLKEFFCSGSLASITVIRQSVREELKMCFQVPTNFLSHFYKYGHIPPLARTLLYNIRVYILHVVCMCCLFVYCCSSSSSIQRAHGPPTSVYNQLINHSTTN